MIERRTGTIINLSGGGADRPAPYWSGYASSKAAILRFTDSLAPEVAPYSIHVYALLPGLVRTAMTEALLGHPRVAEYAPWFPAAFERGSDIPPEEAGHLAVCLANLHDSRLSGRVFTVRTDVVDLEKRADAIAADDLYALRLRTSPPADTQIGPPTHENKALIRRLFVQVVNQQNVDLLDDMVRPEFKVSPNGPSGPDSMKDLIRWLHSAFAELHYELEDLVAEADKVVARTRARGIHSGTYLGVRATGRPVSYTETFTFRIADRQIAEWWTEVNRWGILQQIGVTLTEQ
jgi:predicted ester cyclase